MAAVNDVPQLVDKKGGSYAAIAPKLEPGKFNKWKKRMLCYLAGMEPYYLKCIKDGPFQPKTADGDAKPESQWTPDERRVVVQDQRLKSIIMSCLPDDIMESVISFAVLANEHGLDLVHNCPITTPSSTPISTAFFSNNVIQDFQENSDDEIDERTSEEYLRDLDIEYHERALLENSKRFIKRRNNFSGQKANENTECYKCGNKVSEDYKAEYKKMKAKLSLLEASPSSPQNPKTFQPKNKGLVAETFDWDEEEVSDEEEVTRVKVPMALADDELTVGKSHARNGEWVDITIRKLDAVTFQIQNTKLTKLNHALQEQLKEEKKINENWLTSSKKVSQCISEQILHQKKKVLGGELLIESSSKMNENENLSVPASIGFLVPKSQTVNESLETSNTPESSKDSEAKLLTPLPPLKILQGASPSSEVMSLTFQPHSPKEIPGLGIMKHTKLETHDSSNESVSGTVTMLIDEKINSDQKTQESNSKIQKAESSKSVDSSKISQDSKPKVQSTGSSKSLRPKPIQKPQLKCELCHYTNHSTDDCYRILYCMICKREDHRTSDHEMYIASLKRSKNYKAQPYQYASPSKQILRAKAKPFPPCTHCGFNDHMPDDCNYPECGLYGSYDHSTSGHNRVIQIRGRVLAKSSQSNESSIGRHIREPIWYLDSGSSRSMTGVKSYLHKYVEQPGPKVVFGDNSSCITEGYGSINCGGIVFTKVAFVNGLKYNLISISQLCDAKYILQFDDKQGTIFNANKEIVLITPRRNDVYVLDMSSLTPNGACFFAKASESVNWLWHKRLSHLNFKNINKLAKQNKVLGLPSPVYSKDKPCIACEKGKHHRASFKTKQNFSIRKCLHLLHMDLFGPVSLMFINHEKYTLVIVDEYSRMVENQNDVKVKQIRSDNGNEFINHKLESFYDEKGISQNFSSPYTPEQNGNSLLYSNRSIIVKRHDKTSYEIFRERILEISYFHMFGCPVFIHNHKDHLGKFDAKADDGYFLGFSFVSKAFRAYNIRRQQIEETYHVTFDESIEAIRFTNTLVDEIGIDDSSRYHPDEFQEDDLSRQYQVDSDDDEGPLDPINTEGTHEQNVQNDQIITQPNDVPSGNNTEVLESITEPLVPDFTLYHITNQASNSSHPVLGIDGQETNTLNL
ncbi:retrovirus-related pol polyprotein from transposon TNT 1-94 [Tanacetum coccineum]|uniref:Retrovirus-related pol polyprotein from transposon TNT 1-94 n=1 Tax=Tanacetum coccineum TaxID=301880 RepID=A0ABQ4ZKQ8_9ASTR